jgi:hypothetical protein
MEWLKSATDLISTAFSEYSKTTDSFFNRIKISVRDLELGNLQAMVKKLGV